MTSPEPLSRTAASAAVEEFGWRLLLSVLHTSVRVADLAQGVTIAGAATSACGEDADGHLMVDVRHDHVEFMVHSRDIDRVTDLDVELARRVTAAVAESGLATGGARTGDARSVQILEIAIDAIDIAKVLPFWQAVLRYELDPGYGEALVDPARQGPAVWFQQMDAPRPQRNRIHFDLTVPHDEADARIAAALATGGTLVSAAAARAFWVLADPEGNEICICTWQDRDRA